MFCMGLVFSTEYSFHWYYDAAMLCSKLRCHYAFCCNELNTSLIYSQTHCTHIAQYCRVSKASSSSNRQQKPVAHNIHCWVGLCIQGVAWVLGYVGVYFIDLCFAGLRCTRKRREFVASTMPNKRLYEGMPVFLSQVQIVWLWSWRELHFWTYTNTAYVNPLDVVICKF